MYPYTAAKLKESKRNTLKDFISVAGNFGVSHMMLFT
jgi:ribosome biogenesis protein SSF1/2